MLQLVSIHHFTIIQVVGIWAAFVVGCDTTQRMDACGSCPKAEAKDLIRIKPHHFIDIITDYGRGREFKPHPYGHAVHTVAKKILSDRHVLLEMELGADDICKPCIHNINGVCDDTIDTSFRPTAPSSKREWNLMIDKRWCERLKLKQGDRLTAWQFCERLRDKAGDITDIYREIPAERTAERAEALNKGIRMFLEQE